MRARSRRAGTQERGARAGDVAGVPRSKGSVHWGWRPRSAGLTLPRRRAAPSAPPESVGQGVGGERCAPRGEEGGQGPQVSMGTCLSAGHTGWALERAGRWHLGLPQTHTYVCALPFVGSHTRDTLTHTHRYNRTERPATSDPGRDTVPGEQGEEPASPREVLSCPFHAPVAVRFGSRCLGV